MPAQVPIHRPCIAYPVTYLRRRRLLPGRLLPARPGVPPSPRVRQALVLLVSTCTFQLAHYLDAEPLLACVTMGLIAVNRRWGKGGA